MLILIWAIVATVVAAGASRMWWTDRDEVDDAKAKLERERTAFDAALRERDVTLDTAIVAALEARTGSEDGASRPSIEYDNGICSYTFKQVREPSRVVSGKGVSIRHKSLRVAFRMWQRATEPETSATPTGAPRDGA